MEVKSVKGGGRKFIGETSLRLIISYGMAAVLSMKTSPVFGPRIA